MMVEPFPFARLPALSREEIDLTANVRRQTKSLLSHDAISAALSELTGERVTLGVRRVQRLEPSKVSTEGIGVLFTRADSDSLTDAVLIDVEPTLAATLVARALRQRAPRIVETSREPRPELAGALGAVLHAALRRVHAGTPLRVVAAGPASALTRDIVAGTQARLANVWVTATVGSDVFGARVCLRTDQLPPTQDAVFSRSELAALGEVPIGLPLVATSCLADRALLSALVPGDVFVIPRFPLAPREGVLAGPVALVAPSSERGLSAHLGPDGRLVLGSGPLQSCPWETAHSSPTGGSMSDDPNPTLAGALEDAPVVVRVELGVVELRAREWAALAAGDVLTLGRKLGDPAVLRVGGVEVARGELVQVDGEYGIRILPRTGEQR